MVEDVRKLICTIVEPQFNSEGGSISAVGLVPYWLGLGCFQNEKKLSALLETADS